MVNKNLISAVYIIRNKINNKRYVGSAKYLSKRLKRHKKQLQK